LVLCWLDGLPRGTLESRSRLDFQKPTVQDPIRKRPFLEEIPKVGVDEQLLSVPPVRDFVAIDTELAGIGASGLRTQVTLAHRIVVWVDARRKMLEAFNNSIFLNEWQASSVASIELA
jgi:hypothetical protein